MGGAFGGLLVVLFLGFSVFFVYFTIKQIEFVLNAIPLYREIVSRENRIIDLLQDIQQHHVESEKYLKKLSLQFSDTPVAAQKEHTSISQIHIHNSTNNAVQQNKDSKQGQNVSIKVHKRYTDEENAAIIDGQIVDDDSLAIKVKRYDSNDDTSEIWQEFNCPHCNKRYSVNINGQNVQFKCVHCQNSMLVEISRSKMKSSLSE